MATIAFADGRIVEGVLLTNFQHLGNEGSRSATAHIDGRQIRVYNSIVDGFSNVWYEQVSLEEWIASKGE